jgi:hypothetical protein
MNKIGVLAQYLDTRQDVRLFIKELAVNRKVCLYLKSSDLHCEKYFTNDKNIEVREIKNIIPKNYFNHIWILLYQIFGRLPKSENNYYITENFKLNNSRISFFVKLKQKTILFFSKLVPKFISYDMYLSFLNYKEGTKLNDIQECVCFTQIYDDLFLAELLKKNIVVKVYVYSWDHPCKMKTFSQKANQYYVWNEGLKNDLIDLQKINSDKIKIIGSTQLTFIHNYLSNQKESSYYPFEYFYFACATGYPKLVTQEVNVILEIAKALLLVNPHVKIVVRTYPFFGANDLYKPLLEMKNIIIDDYKDKYKEELDSEKNINDKLHKIQFAKGIMHFGTTLGLEASYFNAPVYLVDSVKKYKELHGFVHQFQNDKYLNLKFKNVIKKQDQFESVFSNNENDLLTYNKVVSSQTKLCDMSGIIKHVYEN